MDIPKNAVDIIETLETAGYEAYVVGGCVRDMILGREPKDWDITTSAKPEEVKSLFRRTIDTGIEHGTVTVMVGKIGYEVTTYRMDGKYADHRHPDEVIFTPSLEEDLKRRDFTINAMAYNPKTGLVDLYGGKEDIRDHIIRAVGNPEERFDEDALRMLRGVRFAGQLGFDIEDKTLAAISEKASTITYTSAERIQVELVKLLTSAHPEKIRIAYETGLTKHFLPEFDEMMQTEQNNINHLYNVGEHTIRVVVEASKNTDSKEYSYLILAAFLHDIGKPSCHTTDENGIDHFYGHDAEGEKIAGKILRRLKFDNKTISTVKTLVRYHDTRYDFAVDEDGNYTRRSKNKMRRLMGEVGTENMQLLFMLQEADILGQSDYHREDKLFKLSAGKRCCDEIIVDADAITISDLAITGSDLITEKGYTTGPAIGTELKRLLALVIDDPGLNTREELLDLAKFPDK